MNAMHKSSSRPPTYDTPSVCVGESGFVPDRVLEGWLRTGEATRAGATLTSRAGQRYLIRDALRVLGRRNGETDPYGFTGRVEALRDIIRQGAIVASDGLRLGAAIYDVEFGVIAHRYGSADESGANPRIG